MKLGRAFVVGKPARHEVGSARAVALLVEDVSQSMRGVRVARMEAERTLHEPPAACRIARLRAREGVHVEEPPVIAVGGSELFEDAQEQLVAVGAPAEAGEAVHAGQEREDQGITRELAEVLARGLERAGEIGTEGEAHRLDVAALARRGVSRELARPCRRAPRLRGSAAHLEDAGPRGMGEGTVGIGREDAVERLGGSHVGGEERVDGRHVVFDYPRRPGAEGQAVAILRRSRAPR